MMKDEQVLSQLLWDLCEAKRPLLDILKDFQRGLTLKDMPNSPVPPLQPMCGKLEKPLECVIENRENMVEEYLSLCSGVADWPYGAFLTALISIMEQNSPWANRWSGLFAKQKQDRKKLFELHGDEIKRLYSDDIIEELRPIVDGRGKKMNDYYRLRWERESFLRKDHFYINLKGVSSSSPILYNNTFGMRLRGGGFYFRWNTSGVVVDPGLYFVANMHEHGLSINDIDAVIVTHDHIDHTGDMMILDDLEHQIKDDKTIRWYVCREIYEAKRLKCDQMCLVSPGHNYELTGNVSLRTTETRHIKDPVSESYLDSTFGCVFKLKEYTEPSGRLVGERMIGYTSDTTYWDGMEKDYDKVDMLIANISSVWDTDVQLESQNELHLGYRGCVKMLHGFEQAPQLFLLSEFWNGLGDIRFPVSKQLRRAVLQKELDTAVLPTEIGMEVDLACMGVKCSSCGAWSKQVSLIKPNLEFGEMHYVCENCVLPPDFR